MPEDPSLRHARLVLRQHQREAAMGMPASARDEHAAALHAAGEYERTASYEDDRVRVGPFRYPLWTELDRWRRTRAVIDRCAPGPYEDGGFLAILARQAASLEMYAAEPEMNPELAHVLERIVFGTTGRPDSHASTRLVGDGIVVEMSAGMMYFLYQAAKSVVLAWHLVEGPEGTPSTFSTRAEDTRAVLDRDPTAADWLKRLLSAWLFDGVPRPPDSSLPPPRYGPALSLLISCAERFVLAHECVHAVVDLVRPAGFADLPVLAGWDKEFRADTWGVVMVVESAARYDRFAPNMALQGPVLAMKAHELVQRALAVVSPTVVSTTHPPFADRLTAVLDAYSAIPGIADEPNLGPEPALAAAETLELLWDRVAAGLEERLRSGDRLHPIWRMP
ncbi:MAG: hypothetical protein HOY78_06485 [Saccharothrix sp.]|nr:hypothetical protein [Saccharothrix sp.]